MRLAILLSLMLSVATPAAAVNWADRGNGVWIDRDSIDGQETGSCSMKLGNRRGLRRRDILVP